MIWSTRRRGSAKTVVSICGMTNTIDAEGFVAPDSALQTQAVGHEECGVRIRVLCRHIHDHDDAIGVLLVDVLPPIGLCLAGIGKNGSACQGHADGLGSEQSDVE
jgi:hypothetical protein